MGNLFAELKRRHIYRVAAAYAVVAWLLLQLFNNLQPILKLPDWAGTLVLVLLIGGLPIILLFAWTLQFAGTDGATKPATTRLDWTLAGGLIAVIAIFFYQQFGATSGTATTPQRASVTAAALPVDAISVAVLPFTNLSSDAEQEFFSDGITEEITAAVAKVPNLKVVARTSAFEFKGQNRNIQSIAQQLHATHIIEGSVRKAGDQVRITAQLIQADNGLHVWTDSYDRQLTNIFVIQEDIAQAIAGALRVPLGLAQGESLVSSRSIDPGSYEQFLRAKALVRARGTGGLKVLTDATALLEQVVARDPEFAPAWALLALAIFYAPIIDPALDNVSVDEFRRITDASRQRAEAAARRAIQLAPNQADGYVSLGSLQIARDKLLAEELFSKALTLDPNNPDGLNQYSLLLDTVGRPKEALAMRQKLYALEPFVPRFNQLLSYTLWLNGQNDAAIAMANNSGGAFPHQLAMIHAAAGRFREAADALLAIPPETYRPGELVSAVRLLREAPGTIASPQSLPSLGYLGFVYLYVGAPDRVLEFGGDIPPYLWHPSYAPVRKTERFKANVRNRGILDYWKQKGWPELCRPVGTDDFVCD